MNHLRLLLWFVALIAGATEAPGQTWPTKPIRAVIPFTAGSLTDVVPRAVFDQLSVQLGQPIVVENRGGAGGTIGTAMVARAEPDGYTMLAHSSAHTIAPAVYPNLSYDVVRDFAAVIPLGSILNVLIVSPAKGYRTLHDLVAAAKAKPGSLTFASAGVGSGTHLSAERFRFSAGYEAVHVPFRGGPEALTEVISGRVDYYFCPLGTALPHIREGRLLALAVSGSKRASALPDVPSTVEAGFPESDYTPWIGLFMPVRTPRAIIERLHAETTKALEVPTVRERLTALGTEPMPMSPAEFDAYVRKDLEISAALAKAVGMKPN